jgi:hypothetical protein
MQGEQVPGLLENAREGNYGTAAMQGLGVLGDATWAAGPVAGGILGTVLKAPGAVAKGVRAARGVDTATDGIRVFHGSPHDYAAERLVRMPDGTEQFLVGAPDRLPDVPEGAEVLKDFPLGRVRLDKMGSGEGAQVYGPGWYGAELEDVATAYRDQLANNFEILNPDELSAIAEKAQLLPEEARQIIREATGGGIPIADNLRASAKGHRYPEMAEALESMARMADRGELVPIPGRMYEANIRANPNDFLDWDKPLREQPPALQQRLRGLLDDQYGRGFYAKYASEGNDARDLLNNFDDIDFMKAMPERGIQGVRYLDAGSRQPASPFVVHNIAQDGHVINSYSFPSREEAEAFTVDWRRNLGDLPDEYVGSPQIVDATKAAESQSRNYSVFNEDLVDLLRKYGIAGLLGGGLLAGGTMAEQEAKTVPDS